MKIHSIFVVAIFCVCGIRCQTLSKITFLVNKIGEKEFKWTNNTELVQKCPVTANLTIMVHGYTEVPGIAWRKPMQTAYLNARGGCVIWMNYQPATGNYHLLAINIQMMGGFLKGKLVELEVLGYNLGEAHMFGFSYGGQLVLEGGYQYSSTASIKFGRINSCDPAGPEFNYSSSSIKNAAFAAKEVQVIHTSKVLGSPLRFGQKCICMGRCGYIQDAAMEDHYSCPTMFTNSFTNDFKFVTKASIETKYKMTCDTKIAEGTIPSGTTVKMGFHLDFSIPDGSYYADSFKKKPFNAP